MLQHAMYYVKVSDKVAAGAGVRGDRCGFSVCGGTELVHALMALLAFLPPAVLSPCSSMLAQAMGNETRLGH